MSTKTLMTAAELERMPDDDSVRTELDEGEVITIPPAGEGHGHYESEFVILLGSFVKRRRLGRIYTGDTAFRLSPNIVRCPDVAFVRAARVAEVRGQDSSMARRIWRWRFFRRATACGS